MKTNTAITAMIIAMVTMIGMTGFAMAGSTTTNYVGDGSYGMNFGGSGTGDLYINTFTSDGSDFQHAGWSNAGISGYQNMDTSTWTEIERGTTIIGAVNGAMATGFTATQTTDNAGDSLTAYAGYHDDDAYGSFVELRQDVYVGSLPYTLENGVGSFTYIGGYAYGADTQVVGQVQAVSNGANNVSVSALVDMREGEMLMDVGIGAVTLIGSAEAAGLEINDMYGDGTGVANINGHSTDQANADFYFDVTNDGAGYDVIGDINGDPISVNLFDDFDTNYDATGYIYMVN